MKSSTTVRTLVVLCLTYSILLVVEATAQKFLDTRTTTKSPLLLSVNNNGAMAFNAKKSLGGLFYPRSGAQRHQYIFGSGLWFGTQKRQSDGNLRAMTLFSYNPNTNDSRFIPGYIQQGDSLFYRYNQEHGVYVSSDYNDKGSSASELRWCMWDNDPSHTPLGTNRYWGNFVGDSSLRTPEANNRPAYYSAEDFICTYKDTDLRYYDIGEQEAKALGYPLRVDVLQRVFTWASGDLASTALIVWELKNNSPDTLFNCWFGYMADPDITPVPATTASSSNDYASYIPISGTHGLQYAWTNTDANEEASSVGVLGIGMVETPAINNQGFGRIATSMAEQLCTTTAAIFSISTTPNTDVERYATLSSRSKDVGIKGAVDIRTLNATGAFHMLPGQMLRIAACITIGGLSTETSNEDSVSTQSLVRNLRAAIQQYYSSIASSIAEDDTNAIPAVLYPNPANEVVYFPYPQATQENLRIEVFTDLGQPVYYREYAAGSTVKIAIDCSAFANGSYRLRYCQGSTCETKQFIVMH